MTCRPIALTTGSPDPARLASFWGGVLGQEVVRVQGAVGLAAGEGARAVGLFWRDALGWDLVWDQDGETAVQSLTGGPKITWGGEPVAPKLGRNRLHWDLSPSGTSTVEAEVERLVGLGARPAPAGCPDGTGLVDPGSHELCLVP